MYTYRFTCGKDEVFGSICHNYATACNEATSYIKNLINDGWIVNQGKIELTQDPFEVLLSSGDKQARIVVGRLTFTFDYY